MIRIPIAMHTQTCGYGFRNNYYSVHTCTIGELGSERLLSPKHFIANGFIELINSCITCIHRVIQEIIIYKCAVQNSTRQF